MKQKIIILDRERKNLAIRLIESLPFEPAHEIDIREFRKNRTNDQNALLWKWYTIIGTELGESKEDIHERYKDVFLVNIYERDNPDYAEMIQSLREVWRAGMKDEAVSLRKRIVALTSTTTATTRQLSEYMDNIERDAATLSIRLPHPED